MGRKSWSWVRGPFVIIFVAWEQGDLKVGKELMQSMDVLHGYTAAASPVDDDDEGQLKL